MSGGSWDYKNRNLEDAIFGYNIECSYGLGSEDYKKNREEALLLDPMGDKELDDLLYDVFCLLESKDYYDSSDIGERTYLEDVSYFKKKWMGTGKFSTKREERLKEYIDLEITNLKKELYVTIEGPDLSEID